MLVADWMTKKVFTVAPGDFVADAARLIKGKGIKHIPVVRGGKPVGIVSDRDIKEYIPSKATCLDIYEMHYLLQSTKITDIMNKTPVTTTAGTPIEEASRMLFDANIGCLPVVDARGVLVGIISDRDIFRALVDITGVRHGGNRVSVTVADKPGSIKELADIIRKHGFSLKSILTSYEGAKKGTRNVVIRTGSAGNFKAMKAEVEGTYTKAGIIKG